ncbi:MAG: PD40 domain-containing protein, partial [Acidobacteriia bacterium]|nr:PD40 domain-containing protein [Terriglobia bacterium]
RFGIWRIRNGESAPSRVTPENIAAVSPSVDPLGRSLAFVQPLVDVNLWLYDEQNSLEPRLLVPSTQAEYSPAFSPDGRRLAFVSDRSGAANIWISALSGGQPRQVTSLRPADKPMWPSWSPDGGRVAFFLRRNGMNYAYETTLAEEVTRPLKGGNEYALFPQYSADGQSLYYASNIGSRFRIWRQPLIGAGTPEPVMADEARFFHLSKDRRYLYFVEAAHPDKLIRINLATKDKSVLWVFTTPLAAFDAWDVTGSKLFYIAAERTDSVSHLMAIDLSNGSQRVIGSVRRLSREWQTSIAASPDGHSVIVTQVDTDETKLMVLPLRD